MKKKPARRRKVKYITIPGPPGMTGPPGGLNFSDIGILALVSFLWGFLGGLVAVNLFFL